MAFLLIFLNLPNFSVTFTKESLRFFSVLSLYLQSAVKPKRGDVVRMESVDERETTVTVGLKRSASKIRDHNKH